MQILNAKIVAWLIREDAPNQFPMCDFEKLRYEIRPCDVLLVEGRSRVSEIIKAITQSSWSHAMLYVGRLLKIMITVPFAKFVRRYWLKYLIQCNFPFYLCSKKVNALVSK